VREVEQYQLDMVGLTSTHSNGPGTKLVERAGLSFPGVAQGVRRKCGATHKSQAEHHCVGVLPGEREGRLRVAGGKALTVVLMHRAAVKSIWPSLSPWVASWKGSIRFHSACRGNNLSWWTPAVKEAVRLKEVGPGVT